MNREFKELTQKEQNELLYYMIREIERNVKRLIDKDKDYREPIRCKCGIYHTPYASWKCHKCDTRFHLYDEEDPLENDEDK